jgi:hypothetical protein
MELFIESDDDIRGFIRHQLAVWSDALGEIELTWFENEDEYQLELHFSHKEPFFCGKNSIQSIHPDCKSIIVIGEISKYKEDAFDTLRKAGRDLFYRLRKEFPLLKRDLRR